MDMNVLALFIFVVFYIFRKQCIKGTYALLALEKVAEILGREVVPVGESDEKEVDLRTSGHLLKHGHELAAVDPPTLRSRFHRIKLLE